MSKKYFVVLLGIFLIISVVALANNDYRTQATTISRGSVKNGSVNGVFDKVDWWKVYLPAGMAVVFLESSETENHKIDISFYTSKLSRIGQDDEFEKFKPVFAGSVIGGTYYIKVSRSYNSSQSIHYPIGVAWVGKSQSHYLGWTGDVDWFMSHIIRADTKTWLFTLDTKANFNPNIYIYRNGHLLGRSQRDIATDRVRWDISSSLYFDIKIKSDYGSGSYWLLWAKE